MSTEIRQGTRIERGVPELGTGLALSQTIDGRPYISAGAASGSGLFTDVTVTGPPVSGFVFNANGNAQVVGTLNVVGQVTGQTLALSSTAFLAASASGGSSMRLPHGAAPTSPQNGDVWTTTAGIFVRINGVTVGPLGVSGGGVSGALAADSLYLDGPARPTGNFLDVIGNASFINVSASGITASTGVFNTYVSTVYCLTTQYFETAGYVKTGPSQTTAASLKMPHGVAPTSPQNGDVWTTTLGMYVRINGVTIGPLGSGGGGSAPDATTFSKGIIQLAGALTGVAASPSLAGSVVGAAHLTQALIYNIYTRA